MKPDNNERYVAVFDNMHIYFHWTTGNTFQSLIPARVEGQYSLFRCDYKDGNIIGDAIITFKVKDLKMVCGVIVVLRSLTLIANKTTKYIVTQKVIAGELGEWTCINVV